MRQELVALAKLADTDELVRAIDAELKQIPRHIAELHQSVDTLEALLSRERQQLDEAERLKVQQRQDLQDRTERLQRARRKTAQVSNVREADAAAREVEINRRAIREREEELDRIVQAIEAKRVSLAEREKDLEEAKSALRQDEASAQDRSATLGEQRARLLDVHSDIVAKVPAPIVKRYERLKKGIVNAVVIVEGANCGACRMALPPQLTIELQRANELHQCPHCRRILIHKTAVDP